MYLYADSIGFKGTLVFEDFYHFVIDCSPEATVALPGLRLMQSVSGTIASGLIEYGLFVVRVQKDEQNYVVTTGVYNQTEDTLTISMDSYERFLMVGDLYADDEVEVTLVLCSTQTDRLFSNLGARVIQVSSNTGFDSSFLAYLADAENGTLVGYTDIILEVDSTDPVTITLYSLNVTSVNWEMGGRVPAVRIVRRGSGSVTITPNGCTLNGGSGSLSISSQYGSLLLYLSQSKTDFMAV